jgi:hypothetical protein
MDWRWRGLAGLAVVLTVVQWGACQAQYDRYLYPRGYAGYGWGGWGGGGGGTVQGSIARGMGAFAAGAGVYNVQTAQANAINANTVMAWNQYMYESQQTANRAERERLARRQFGTTEAHDKIYNRLRNTPDLRDINQGDALNVALDEINDPRVYTRSLELANVKIGGELIRDIPFQHAAAAITTSFHQITQGPPPPVLLTPEFETRRLALKALGQEIRKQLDEGKTPDPATTAKALTLVNEAEARVDKTLPRNSRDRVEADKYLKSVHGLLTMLQTPAINVLLSGVEKRPEATLGELLTFMNAFNLRFGPAKTDRQRQVYSALYPKLVALRDQIATLVAAKNAPPKVKGTEPGEFFSGMNDEDLKKKAPAPSAPAAPSPKPR